MTGVKIGRLSLFVVCLLGWGSRCQAIELTLTLDSSQSALSGDLFVNPVDASAASQDPPADSSLTTGYSGTITIDVDDLLNPTTIRVISAEAIAGNSGDWLPDANGGSEGDPDVDGDSDPGNPEPANYGWLLDLGAVGTLWGASRDTVLDMRSTERPVSNGEFDPLGIYVKSPEGTLDGNVSSAIFGDDASTQDVASEAGYNCTDVTGDPETCGGQQGTYSVADGTATLTLPFNFKLGTAHGRADFNLDEEINVLDYPTWRDNLGSTTNPEIDADGSGVVDQGDYEIWKLEYGDEVDDSDDDFVATFTGQFVATATVAGSAGSVPEPTSLLLWGMVLLAASGRRIRMS